MNESSAQIEVIRPGASVADGSVARVLEQHDFNINSLRTNDTLRKEEWLHFDQTLVEIARKRLVVVEALASAGLRYDIPGNAMGTMSLEWEKISDLTRPVISMDGVTEGPRDRPMFGRDSMDIPIVHKDFSLNVRALEASRSRGQPLDTTMLQMCGRLITEEIERYTIRGSSDQTSGVSITGFVNAPNKITDTTSVDWCADATTGDMIVKEVLEWVNTMKTKADDDGEPNAHYGPYGLFVNHASYTCLGDDYKANSDKTIMQRLLEIPDISFIRPSHDLYNGTLPDGTTGHEKLLVQLTSEVVEMVVGFEPIIVQWDTIGGLQHNFKVMAIMLPRFRTSYTNQSGILYAT